jgi:PAS domain S-box-containing protein
VGGEGATARQVLEPVPTSAGAARRLVRDVLARAGRDDLLDTAELVVSELVTNAMLHTATQIDLRATVDEHGLHLEVADGSPTQPTEREHAALAGTGRGLALVHDLTEQWGVRAAGDGKVVWARVTGVTREAGDGLPTQSAPAAAGLDVVDVALHNVPLLIHLAWHEHAETLLREYLLARLELDETAALADHALASTAMSLLHEQLPAPALPGGARALEEVTGLLTVVTEPTATLALGWLRVPVDAVAAFDVLDSVMDAAVAMADADELLAAPMQPELRELRRWLCREVASQSAGRSPVPWRPPSWLPAPGTPVRTGDWDHAPVDRSTKALVAADDTNRIVAVSQAALDLLGYAAPSDLVGQRLLTLIPDRFHQAHLTGFTLFLTQGRAPLVDTSVVVPFRCADGTERELVLLLEALSLADGRRVFVATLDPVGTDTA